MAFDGVLEGGHQPSWELVSSPAAPLSECYVQDPSRRLGITCVPGQRRSDERNDLVSRYD